LPEREVKEIFDRMHSGADKPRHKVEFEVGEVVRVKEGPFADFNGNVDEVNYEKSKVRLTVSIFGRPTPVDLDFSQIEKT
jgi:transcriptional antiterminator NusG